MRPTARPCEPGDRRWVEGLLEEHMGSTRVARLGEVIEVTDLPGLIAGRGCRRLWLLTSNDNLRALGFYQQRGLRLCALHAGALARDRALKPEIPEVNPDNGIPLRDLLELELPLRVPGPAAVVRTPGR
jgi:hypothetical protein